MTMADISVAPQAPASLSRQLLEATRDLHRRAERSGIVQEILRGRAAREGYVLFLRNLHAPYAAMEVGLSRLAGSPALAPLARREVYRTDAIAADLACLAGPEWQRLLPLLPAGRDYARLAARAAEGSGERLVAHAYVRYLGDLSGGRVLARMLGRSLGLGSEALAFYAFDGISDVDAFKGRYRDAIDAAGVAFGIDAIVAEALRVFELNIELSEAVLTSLSGRRALSA
jgi:heme oxygenase